MLRRSVIAALLAVAALLLWSVDASTLESTSTSDGIHSEAVTVDRSHVQDHQLHVQQALLAEQAGRARAALLEHHARLEQQRQQIQEAALAHQEMQQRELGARAPTETVPPMATIPPPVEE